MGIQGGLLKPFLAVLPFTLVGVLGAYNHVALESFDTPEFGATLGSRVQSYVEPMRLVQVHLGKRGALPSSKEVLTVADVWVEAYRNGKLLDIPSVCAADTTNDGVRDQILTAKGTLVFHLNRISTEAQLQGNVSEATRFAAKAFIISRIMRGSDLSSLGTSLSEENSSLRRLVAVKTSSSAIDVNQVSEGDVKALLASDYRLMLSSPQWTDSERASIERNFNEAENAPRPRLAGDTPQASYAIAMMFSQLRRVNHLRTEQTRLLKELQKTAPSLVAQGGYIGKPSRI